MKQTIKILSILIALFTSVLFLSFSSFKISDQKTQEIISKTNLANLRLPQENIYLHLDRPSYWANDDIWFKAYVKNSPVNECNLYVELINSSGSLVYKKISWVQNGLAYGDIQLEETLPSGIYQIRAYTNWMRNFNHENFFRKDVVIWNLSDKEIIADAKELKQRNIDLQFFAEGGTFVSEIKNKVAFKAIDSHGKGIDFVGEIVDDSGEKIANIQSLFNGIGSFVFEPQDGKRYSAEVRFANDIAKSVNLPNPKKEGIILVINALDSAKIEIQLIEKSLGLGKDQKTEYLIVGQSGGEICYHKNVVASQELQKLEIQKESLPGGIIKFTLFDSNFIPVCERLVFNNHVNVVKLFIQSDKKKYTTREKVKIGAGAFTKEGQPCLSNLSMSVYNPNTQLKREEYPNTIFTHFLLNSELKGNIEDPSYYFKDDSLTTQIALDNLMLTHGYRYFEWNEILEDKYPDIDFQPESSIELKGKVVSTLMEKPLENCKVTMMTVKSLLGVYEEVTDSLGQFIFPNLFFYDTIQVSLQARNEKGRKNTSIQIDRSSITSPEVNFLPFLYEYNEEKPVETLNYLSESKSDLIKRKWSLSDTILLDEIYVTARKKATEDGHFRIYNDADFVFDMKKQDKLDVGNIFDGIEGRIPGVRHEPEDDRFMYRGKSLMLYLDGMPADYGLLRTFPGEAIDKVELVKMGIFAGVNTDQGILFFYTKRGEKFINVPMDKKGMRSAKIIGYSPTRKFYTPKYESKELPEIKTDYRNTIYWNPVVRTDSTGFAEVEFYNSDEMGNIQIVIEGVTSDGKLCRGLSEYKVTY